VLSLAVYSAAAHGEPRWRNWVCAGCLLAVMAEVSYEATTGIPADMPTMLPVALLTLVLLNFALYCAMWALGSALGSRRRRAHELLERTVELEQEREANASRAVFDERVRIARELHDVVAHHVSMMGVQAGFGETVYAPADGRVIDVRNSSPDQQIGDKGTLANLIVIDIGSGRYVVMAHLKQHSVRPDVGDRVLRGQPLAQVGNSGESDEPHLHMHVQNRPYDYTGNHNNLFSYPMSFRDARVKASGIWPRANAGELRSGDRISP
jgi:hypothetical protein